MKLFSRNGRHATGFSLIEVMFAAAILALGLLAITHYQINNLLRAENNYYRFVAMQQLNNISVRLRAECVMPSCQTFDTVMETWNAENATQLIRGRGEMMRMTPQCWRVILHWESIGHVPQQLFTDIYFKT